MSCKNITFLENKTENYLNDLRKVVLRYRVKTSTTKKKTDELTALKLEIPIFHIYQKILQIQ